MSEAVSRSLPAVAAMRAALEEMAEALAQASLERVLDCEAAIEAALGPLRSYRVPAADLPAVRADIDAARAALARCRRLGLSLHAFAAAAQAAVGNDAVYGADATLVGDGPHALNLTV